MMSRGDRCRVSVRGSEIDRRFDAPMLSRRVTQKEAEHANHAALLSVARLKASRAARPAPAARAAGSGKSGLALNCQRVLRRAQRASSHTPNRNPKGYHSANTPRAARPVNGNFPRHQIGAWRVGEGEGNNRDKF
jgi:hypothetical protein